MTKPNDVIEALCNAGLWIIGSVLNYIIPFLESDPETALEEDRIGKRRKKALRIDRDAEDFFRHSLRICKRRRFYSMPIYGEESLRNPQLDLSKESRIVALVDAVDGSDLLERNLSNWCSACVFLDPSGEPGGKILCAFVGLPSKRIYYASCLDDKSYVRVRGGTLPVAGTSGVKGLEEASICFYGQKITNFRSLVQSKLLDYISSLNEKQVKKTNEEIGFRIYNLAGNPVMVKLVDHRIKDARGIDAVIEIKGQKPHDMAPGAYIALKGGAVLKRLDGSKITLEDLENALLKPASQKLSYVLASTEELADEIINHLG